MNEGLGMAPKPSSFLPLIFVLDNSTNLVPFTCILHLSLSKLPPTSDITHIFLLLLQLLLVLLPLVGLLMLMRTSSSVSIACGTIMHSLQYYLSEVGANLLSLIVKTDGR